MTRAWTLLVSLVRVELRLYAGLARWVARRPSVPPDARAHPYVGGSAAVLWAFTVVSAVELVALHLVIPWEPVRLVADVLGVWGVLWCLGFTACHYVHPHLTDETGLHVRGAAARPVAVVPWSLVASVAVRETSHPSSRQVQVLDGADGSAAGDGARLVVGGSRTNVHLRLRRPLPVEVHRLLGVEQHEVREVQLVADDPRALATAVREHLDVPSDRRSS